MPTADAVKAWYNELYAAKGLGAMRPVEAYAMVLDLLDGRPAAALLDVSCGTGYLLRAATERGLRACGVDISEAAVRLARQVASRASVAVSRGEALPFRDGQFQYLSCLGSLEHFLDVDQGVREMRRVTRSDGRCVVMVPNRLFAGWWLLRRVGTSQQDVQELLLTLGQWRRLFTRHGFTVLDVRPDLWHADKWRTQMELRRWALFGSRLLSAAWRLVPLWFQYQFVFLLRRD